MRGRIKDNTTQTSCRKGVSKVTNKKWHAWASYGFPTGDVDIATSDTFLGLLEKLAENISPELLRQLEAYEDVQVQIAFTED